MSRGSKRKPKKEVRRAERPRKFSGEIILIVCEGEKTEPGYFHSLREEWRILPAQVRILDKTSGWTPITVVENALECKKQVEKEKGVNIDEVWCIFDQEGCHEDARYREACDLAKKHKVKLVISWPCFEYWYLLHYVYTTKSFEKCSAVIKELKKYIKKYNKSNHYFDTLYPKLETALAYAKKVRHHNKKSNTMCPATDVDLLVAKLKALKRG